MYKYFGYNKELIPMIVIVFVKQIFDVFISKETLSNLTIKI